MTRFVVIVQGGMVTDTLSDDPLADAEVVDLDTIHDDFPGEQVAEMRKRVAELQRDLWSIG